MSNDGRRPLEGTGTGRSTASAAGVAPLDDLFIADLCHRVRTPLNGILGALELLLAADVSDEARELARAAFDSAAALHQVFEAELHAVSRAPG